MKGSKAGLTFILILTIVTLGLAGCGSSDKDDDTGTTNTTISGLASKGLIKGGTVKVFALDAAGNKGNALGSPVVTNANGAYSVQIGSYTGNVLVEITGGTYTDEATMDPNTPAPSLKAALSGAQGSVSVAITPLTDIAVKCAGTALTKEKIDASNYLVGTAFGILDIVGTMPHDINGSTDKFNEANYGLMLAAISQMSDTQGKPADQIISAIASDLADKQLNGQGQNILTAYNKFAGSAYNKTEIKAVPPLIEDAINHAANKPIVIPDPGKLANLTKAKGMVADLRNTISSIYDYQGIGVEGIVETPFNNLSEELTTKMGTDLSSTVERIGWILDSMKEIPDNVPPPYTFTQGNLKLELTATEGDNIAGLASASFTVKDTSQNPAVTLDSGSLTLTANAQGNITSGTFAASMSAPDNEKLTANLNYTGTYTGTGKTFASITLTGSLGFIGGISYDFSQEGRKLSATFAQNPPNAPEPEDELIDCYPTQVFFSGRIKTTTAQMDGTLNISNIVWNSKAIGVEDYDGPNFAPQSATFKGTFQELKNEAANGAKFTGEITGSWTNADTYNLSTEESSSNVPIWNAAFDGSITAPQRPTIETHLGVSQTGYKTGTISVSYRRMNVNNTVVYLSGEGTYNVETKQLHATLSNQDNLKLTISSDDTDPDRSKRFTGTITTSTGTKLADLYTMNGVPTVKYLADDCIESLN